MSSNTLPVCPKTGSTSPSLTVHLCLHTALLREIGNAPLQYPASASTVSGCASNVSFTASSNTGNSPWSLAFAVRSVATTNWCSASTAACAL